MRVLLVDPPQKLGCFVRVTAVSQGLASLAAVLEAEHEVRVADFVGLPGGWADYEAILKGFRPECVAVTCTHTCFWYAALQCAALAREVVPGALVVGGGSQFQAMAADALATGNVDVVVCGEGEEALPALLRRPGHPGEVPGVIFPAREGLARTPGRPYLQDLDQLPSPAWRHFPMRRHGITAMGGARSTVLTTSHGCLNRCTFCSEGSFWRGSWRGWSGERAAEELRRVHRDHGKVVFYLGDNDFLVDPERVEAFCRALRRRRPAVYLWVQTTCRHAVRHRGLLPLLREVGAYQVMMGLESVSPKVLRAYRKPQDLSLMEEAISAVKTAGLAVMGCWMWGDLHDDEQTLRQGVAWVLDRCDFLAPSVAMPYPGTPYHARCQREGRIEERDLSKYGKFHFVMPTAAHDRQECARLFDRHVFSRRWVLHNLRTWMTSLHPPARWYARTLLLTEVLYRLDARLSRRFPFDDYCRETRGRPIPWRPRESPILQRSVS